MATKGHFLLFKDVTVDNNIVNRQYSNLNLNQNQRCFSSGETIPSKHVATNDIKAVENYGKIIIKLQFLQIKLNQRTAFLFWFLNKNSIKK